MSTTINDLVPLITCENNDLDCCTLFKMLLVKDSLNNTYIRGLYGLAGNLEGTFTSADIINVIINGEAKNVIPVTHNFNMLYGLGLLVNDNNGELQTTTYYPVDANSLYIIISGTVTGTWYYKIFK